MSATSNHLDVAKFHHKFKLRETDIAGVPGPVPISEDLYLFRKGFLKEELDEFQEAWECGDMAGLADALIDLVYVALGTAHLFGIPWQPLWDEVQRANMSKERGTASTSKRNSEYDVIKPEGWTPPDIAGILEQWGFPKEIIVE